MNHDNQNNLDLLQLYKESLSELTVGKKEIENINESVELSMMKSFMKGEKIYCIKEKNFLSSFLLVDVLHDTYYPFLFFKVKQDGNTITYEKSLPIFNQAALLFLDEATLLFDSKISLEDIEVLYTRLSNLIVTSMMTDRIRLVPYLCFRDEKTIESNRIFSFLRNYIFGFKDDEKYDALFKETEDHKTEEKILQNTIGFFAKMERVYKREDAYHGSSLSITEPSIMEAFLLRSLFNNGKKKESTLILTSPEEKNLIFEMMEKYHLQDFIGEVKYTSDEEIDSKLDEIDSEDITPEERKKISSFHMKKERLLSFQNKKEEAYLPLKPFRNVEYLTKFHNEKSYLLNLDLSHYTEMDAKRDENFFSVLNELTTIRNSYVANHPYHGLTCSYERENYSKLQLILINLIKYLKEMIQKVKEEEFIRKYELKVSSMHDFAYLLECGRLIMQYNGFPRRYFRFPFEEEEKYPLLTLKKAYQAVSSSTLMLKNLCEPSFFECDLEEVYQGLSSIKRRKRKKAQKELLSHLKMKGDFDFETFTYLLKAYLDAKEKLSTLLPVYQNVYGESILTMNGLVEIESNLEYVRKFLSFSKEHPSFNIDHPFIKRALRERDFRMDSMRILEEASQIYDCIKENLTKYICFFRDIPNDGLYDLSFEELKDKFVVENMNTYEEFMEYVSFIKAKSEASELLSVIINRYIRKKRVLSTLQDDFSYSILYTAYQNGKENFQPYEKDYQVIRKDYFSSLLDDRDTLALEWKMEYHHRIEQLKTERIPELKKQMGNEFSYRSRKENREAKRILASSKIACIASTDDLYFIDDDLFDHVLILNSVEFSPLHLLSAFRISKNRIFVNYQKEMDRRTQTYHDTILSRNNLYNKVIPFSSLPNDFLSYFEEEMKKMGYVVKKNDERYSFLIEKENQEYAVFPDVFLDHKIDIASIVELETYLVRFEGIRLILLDTFGFLFEQEESFFPMERKDEDERTE